MTRRRRCISFRIYPENKALYYVVNVWPDKKSMRLHLLTMGKDGSNCSGMCSPSEWWKNRNGKLVKSPRCGEINVCHELDCEIITHEVTHATLAWARRIGLDTEKRSGKERAGYVSDNEERFCYALGRMSDQFFAALFRRGLAFHQLKGDRSIVVI